jgi:predicted metalloendopeptidase
MTLRTPVVLLAGALIVLPACSRPPAAPPAASAPVVHGIDVAGMDRSVKPGDDFNAYANGGWAKATTIPADKSSAGPWATVSDLTRQRTADLIRGFSSAGTQAGDEERKIGDFYAAYMDEAAIESKGYAPLAQALEAIAAIGDRHALARAIGATMRADVDPLNNTNFQTGHLFGVFVSQGLDDPSHNVPYLLQGGLGLPDREYYLSSTPQMAAIRTAYQTYLVSAFSLAGLSDPQIRAAHVLALETKIARAHATRVASADVSAARRWRRADFASKAPGLDWPAFFDAASLSAAPDVIVWQPKAVPGLAALVASEPLDAWKDWLAFHAMDDVGNVLPKAFVDARFACYGKALSGVEALRPRWQRGVDFTSDALGEAVGKAYVARYFPAETKARVQAMVGDLIHAFGARIDALTWMSAATKAKAKDKLATLRVGVGYPDTWRDYSGLVVQKDDAFGNFQRASLFDYKYFLAKLGQTPDRSEWWMTPQTVNAVNLPLQNALNFPAAFIQPPFFDPDADAAYNYGSMGAVIGHEISHSFDDQGSQFDAEGRLANWWTKEDLAHFHAAGQALAAQFDKYRPFPDLAVNGHQTLSENIADVAGLSVAYDAYRLSLHGQLAPQAQGFSGDQEFFISYAQGWRSKEREAALRQRITTDGHAPDEYRADSVRNLDAWYAAFDVQPGQTLYLAPNNRVRVW